MKYHTRNINNLNKLADKTKEMAFKWYQYCVDNKIEVLIYETIRTKEKQRQYVNAGKSQTMRSYHIVGQAFDFVPIKADGTEDWSGYKKEPWASAIRHAKKLGFEWGGDWKGFVDSPHMQLNHKGYGTDTFKTGDMNIASKSYRIVMGDFDTVEWFSDTFKKTKEVLPGYGVWEQCLDNKSHRIIVGDFNTREWADKTLKKLETAFPGYGKWVQEV